MAFPDNLPAQAPPIFSIDDLIVKKTPWIDVRAYGVKATNTAAENTTKFTDALAVASLNTIVVPPGQYNVNTLAVTLDDVCIELMYGAKLIFQDSGSKGFDVSGKRFQLRGPGTIEMPAAWNDDNVQPTYAVVWITGNDPTVDGVKFINIPKVGIELNNVENAMVTRCRIDGNFPPGSFDSTGHFGIHIDPPATSTGGNIIVQGNIVRTCVQGIQGGNFGAASDALAVNIVGNVVEGCHDHAIYLGSSSFNGATISFNSCNRCANAIACTGKYHTVMGNTIVTTQTGNNLDAVGISMRDPVGCVVMGNTLKGDVDNNSTCVDIRGLAGTICKDNVISGNVIDITAAGLAAAIRIGDVDDTDVQNNVVSNNIIRANGISTSFGLIHLQASALNQGKNNIVSANRVVLTNECNGINLINQLGASVFGNKISLEYNAVAPDDVVTAIKATDCVKCDFSGNHIVCESTFGTNVIFRGILEAGGSAAGSVHKNNLHDVSKALLTSYQPHGISGTGTLAHNIRDMATAAGNTFTFPSGVNNVVVSNPNVGPIAQIIIVPVNANAGTIVATQGIYVTVVTDTSFTVLTADGNNTTVSGSFRYYIF